MIGQRRFDDVEFYESTEFRNEYMSQKGPFNSMNAGDEPDDEWENSEFDEYEDYSMDDYNEDEFNDLGICLPNMDE